MYKLLILLGFIFFACNNEKRNSGKFELSDSSSIKENENHLLEDSALNSKTINDIYIFENDFPKVTDVSKSISIELIAKQLFVEMQKKSINYLIDTNLFIKNNGVLNIKTEVKNYIFKDNFEGFDETHYNYEFLGQFKEINKLLVKYSYLEGSDNMLIDKTTGKTTLIPSDLPYLLLDKKILITCGEDIDYQKNTNNIYSYVSIYKVEQDSATHLLEACYKNWFPTFEKSDKFWGTDHCFYLAIQPKENLGTDNYYIRIRLKNLNL